MYEKNGEECKVFSFDLCDNRGEIHISSFNKDAKYYDLLKADSVFAFLFNLF